MSGHEIKRRDFLKVMGWGGVGATLAGCDMPTTVTLEEGKEEVVSYMSPEEFVIPGIGIYYASTCQQCSAGCGIYGRVREGRVLKLEGNPASQINGGKLCQMGQAGVQTHYNPDRITKPMLRKGKELVEVSWDEAMAELDKRVGKSSSVDGQRVAWFSGSMSGHQSVLLDAYLESVGSKSHFVYEAINSAVSRAVNAEMLGDATPHYRFDKAALLLSFGADLLGASSSPVHYSTQYGEFRSAPRGMHVQIEPSMSLTGANADLWQPVIPGTEGVLAYGLINMLVNKMGYDASGLSLEVRGLIGKYDPAYAAKVTGISEERIEKIAGLLKSKSPSLVLAGTSTEGQRDGYNATAAVTLLNVILGNVGKTIESSGTFPFPQMAAKAGSSRDLLSFASALGKKQYDVVFFHGTNPVHTAPNYLGLVDNLADVPFKVTLSMFLDETAAVSDLVLPLLSSLEDWGTHVADVGGSTQTTDVTIQQPLMKQLYDDTRGFGDIVLSLLKARGVEEYTGFDDYYAYLRDAFSSTPEAITGGLGTKAFWQGSLQKGAVSIQLDKGALQSNPFASEVSEHKADPSYPMHLAPSARLGMWDGRHANIPWLQEAPDQISKVVWESWAEIHPSTAAKMGVTNGDMIKVESRQGAIKVKVYVHRGVHPNVVAVPMGRGHEQYGRYAKGRGVNPLKILSQVTENKTGELALYGTRVKVSNASDKGTLIHMGDSESQVGRKLVSTVTAEVFKNTEGGGNSVA
ncbi:MAG: molybdopterin-dependent oxidoreductase [Gammaproteobacteria bacterium]|nr:molybdopterin-dependent oxidoreductase [Gammaproteobacteria bacterium]